MTQINPKPWLFLRMRWIIFYNFSFDSYSGNKKTLKQVWAVGRFVVFACLWITKLSSFIPSIGTRSEPVAKIRNDFLSSKSRECNISQKFLYKNKKLLDDWSVYGISSLVWCSSLELFKVDNIIAIDDCFEILRV